MFLSSLPTTPTFHILYMNILPYYTQISGNKKIKIIISLNMSITCIYIFSINSFRGVTFFLQLLIHVQLFASPWAEVPRFPCPSLCPKVSSDSYSLGWWCYLTITSSAVPFSLLHSIFPSIRVFSNDSALQGVTTLI